MSDRTDGVPLREGDNRKLRHDGESHIAKDCPGLIDAGQSSCPVAAAAAPAACRLTLLGRARQSFRLSRSSRSGDGSTDRLAAVTAVPGTNGPQAPETEPIRLKHRWRSAKGCLYSECPARVAELADALDLGSSGATRAGSSPVSRNSIGTASPLPPARSTGTTASRSMAATASRSTGATASGRARARDRPGSPCHRAPGNRCTRKPTGRDRWAVT